MRCAVRFISDALASVTNATAKARMRLFVKRSTARPLDGLEFLRAKGDEKENNTRDSNVVPHRSTNRARACLTSQSGRDVVLSCWYGRSRFQSCVMQ